MTTLPPPAQAALRRILASVGLFAKHVLGIALWPYQLAPLEEILQSILQKDGREFLIVFPRQSGKNEAVAVLLVYLLNLLQRKGGGIVFAAIGDGIGRGVRRLEERLNNPWNRTNWHKSRQPVARWLGKAYVAFVSSHTGARSRGETAHYLIVVDELQDQDPLHIEAVLEPMRAFNNATAVYIGTVRSKHDALYQKKGLLEKAEAVDGLRRVYVVGAEEVATHNPAWGQFLANKEALMGRHHPIVAAEYHNEPIDGDGGLFDSRRRALMFGTHAKLDKPETAEVYLMVLDVGGEDEAGGDPLTVMENPARDYAAVHILRIVPNERHYTRPRYEAVSTRVWHGRRFFNDAGGGLAEEIAALYRHWGCIHLVGDATGVGSGLVSWLAAELGEVQVTRFVFSRTSKAKLGSDFIALIESGRWKYFDDGRYTPASDSWWMDKQAEQCTYAIPAGGIFDKDLRWGVPERAAVDTPAGRQLTHDDRLISGALAAVADELQASGKIVLARRTLLYW
jgi:hypothetical protein